MAIRISMAPLAGAVARAGGIGLIAASGLEHDELRSEICKARELAGSEGIIGINIMVAANDFKNIVHVAMDAGIDLIVVGAGFSRDVFEWGITRNVPIVPIVSSAKLAKISEKLGASAIIVEGTEAGGHLGTDRSTWDVIPEVLDAVSVPVIAAGGIFSGDEFVKMMNLGVSGIQMATRFGASVESSAAMEWKQKYIEAKTPEEIVKIMSPVGLPGRAIVNTEFTRKILAGPVEIESCDNCLRKCSHTFCIILSLINAQQGDVENGIVFAGSNAWRVNEVKTTEEIINDLGNEIDEYISSKN
jgi:NAD(P)H-dependent flavin oxidoreductase YrpB (nitropropane dioxygenase family)